MSNVLRPGTRVRGILPDGPVEILEVSWTGGSAVVKYLDGYGLPGSRFLSRDLLAELSIDNAAVLDLAGDHHQFCLAIEALRIRHAAGLNPMLAVSSANVEPLPHQVQAVYDYLLPRRPLRFLLADDPGAGKTIMTGLYIKEALARGLISRCVIVAPGSLVEQWQDELLDKMGLRFEVFDPAVHRASGNKTLDSYPHVIIRMDQFSRNPDLQELVRSACYDLAVVDEAHKLTARYWGNRVMKSKRFEFGELLRDSCDSLLLLTATPHNGKEAEFQLFLRLLGTPGSPEVVQDVQQSGLMRRLIKEQLVRADGSPLFPPRIATTVGYRLSALEHDLYDEVTEYVRHQMNKVTGDETRRAVGFALLVLQRRLASSPEAILRSLKRRRDRLQEEVVRVRLNDDRLAQRLEASLSLRVPDDADEVAACDEESFEDSAASVATAARTVGELETEVLILNRLVEMAQEVRTANVDEKWEALARLLQSDDMFDDAGRRRKIIIFTEHRDTLEYLEDRLYALLGRGQRIEVIHGGIDRGDRRLAQVRFTEDERSTILLATDAAGEGVNLQAAHLMTNYDIPWNPNRLDQRFGRIHRIGQTEVCYLWNLVALDTREGAVFETLLHKLEVQRQALGDQVFDVLGEVLTDSDLRDLLTRALQGGSRAEVAQTVEAKIGHDLADAVERRNTSVTPLTPADLRGLRNAMALAKARQFQPTVMRDFTTQAMTQYRGDLRERSDTWAIRHVPERVRHWSGLPDQVIRARYETVTFKPNSGTRPVASRPELMAPGHPLLTALTGVVLEDFTADLTAGVVLQDDRSASSYVLVSFSCTRNGSLQGASMLSTYMVGTDGRKTPADAAAFTSLDRGRGPVSSAELEQTRAAIVTCGEKLGPDCELRAVAYVRGIATVEAAQAWTDARRALLRDLENAVGMTPAIPFTGWDVSFDVNGALEFATALPELSTGLPSLRRCEDLAQENLGQSYRIAVAANDKISWHL